MKEQLNLYFFKEMKKPQVTYSDRKWQIYETAGSDISKNINLLNGETYHKKVVGDYQV